MPVNCKSVSVEDVIKFFEDDIDGMGIHGSYPRNQGVPGSLRQSQAWKLCELTKDDFMRLEIPDGTKTLIKDKSESGLEGIVKSDIKERIEELKRGEDLSPLIIRKPLQGDNAEASFYIEDGAKRAIAYKFYFESYPYRPVKAYIGYERV